MTARPPVLVLDIGGTKIAGALVTGDGQLLLRRQVPTAAEQGGEAVAGRAIGLAQAIREQAAALPGCAVPSPAALGVSSAGDIDPATGAVIFATSALPGWAGLPLAARCAAALNLPAFVANDGHLMALGEAACGAGRGCKYLAGLTVGTGIGGGLILGGRIYHGAGGVAGAAGHIIVDYEGRRACACGGAGCLEAYASGPAIVQDFAARVGAPEVERLGLTPGGMGVKEIAALARQGHVAAQAAIEQGAWYLGIGIASLLNLLNLEAVIVGGGVAQIGEPYLVLVRQAVQARAKSSVRRASILAAELGPDASLLGAAELAWQGLAGKHSDTFGNQVDITI